MVFAGIEHPTSRLWGERANPYRSLSQWDKAIGPREGGEGRWEESQPVTFSIWNFFFQPGRKRSSLELFPPGWKKKFQPGSFSSQPAEKFQLESFSSRLGEKPPTRETKMVWPY